MIIAAVCCNVRAPILRTRVCCFGRAFGGSFQDSPGNHADTVRVAGVPCTCLTASSVVRTVCAGHHSGSRQAAEPCRWICCSFTRTSVAAPSASHGRSTPTSRPLGAHPRGCCPESRSVQHHGGRCVESVQLPHAIPQLPTLSCTGTPVLLVNRGFCKVADVWCADLKHLSACVVPVCGKWASQWARHDRCRVPMCCTASLCWCAGR